jgi:hypothetical protein
LAPRLTVPEPIHEPSMEVAATARVLSATHVSITDNSPTMWRMDKSPKPT